MVSKASRAESPESFPLSPGWLAFLTLGGPAMFAALIILVLERTEGMEEVLGELGIPVLWGLLVVVVAVRLPLLAYTVLFDRSVVLNDDAVHVPIAGLFQLRPWNLAYADIASVARTRRPGWSPVIVFTLRDSSRRKISTTPFSDEFGLLAALEARIAKPSRGE